jgi:hypothetical protein
MVSARFLSYLTIKKDISAQRDTGYEVGSVVVDQKGRYPLTYLKGSADSLLLKRLKQALGCNGRIVTDGPYGPALAFQGGSDLAKRLILYLKQNGLWGQSSVYVPIPSLDLTVPPGSPLG